MPKASDASFSLRPARLADAEAIRELIFAHRDALVPRALGDIVSCIDRFIVAECGGTIAGCASYHVWPEIGNPLKATVEIQSVAVDDAFRRRGIGGELVKGVIGRVKPFEPAEVMVLTLTPEFFASLGFREIPKTRIMHKLYAGCINCTKHADPFTCPERAMMLPVG